MFNNFLLSLLTLSSNPVICLHLLILSNNTITSTNRVTEAIITPEDKAAKIAHKKSIISHIKDSIECRKCGVPEENPFPETIEDKVRQIKELELEIKEIEAKTQ
jgi:hypothetical protein